MINTYLQPIIDYLHLHPHAAGIIVFFIAFAEALAVIGTIVPGSVTMTAVGVLVGSKVIPASSTFAFAIIGAIFGDLISYWVGRYYKDRIHKIWPFTRYPNWLNKGEEFFRKHGVKSIIIGRFFGPGRSLVPLIAGSFKMGHWRFILAAIPSASIWAVMYMIPGILLGALSLELPKGLAYKFILGVLIVILITALISCLVKYFFEYLSSRIDRKARQLWHYWELHKNVHFMVSLLTAANNRQNYRQVILLAYAFISGLLFLLLAAIVHFHGWLTYLNRPLFYLFFSLRSELLDKIAIVLTTLGSSEVILTSTALIFVWFVIKRYWRLALHWAILMSLTIFSIQFFKILIASPRPIIFLNEIKDTLSFPSGHTALGVSFFGFLAALIGYNLKSEKRNFVYIIAAIAVILIGSSRLFLCAHWVTDILGGILLSISLVLLVVISYRRVVVVEFSTLKFVSVISAIIVICWSVFCIHDFARLKRGYIVKWPSYQISYKSWERQSESIIPLFRTNRFGTPIEVFNVEWVGDLDKIKQSLSDKGWQIYETEPSVLGMLQRLADNNKYFKPPLIPQLYRNQYPELLMIKILPEGRVVVLRLWSSGIEVGELRTPLWLGIVNYYRHPHTSSKIFNGANQELITYLGDYQLQKIIYHSGIQPEIMQNLHWDGNLLLIKNKGAR